MMKLWLNKLKTLHVFVSSGFNMFVRLASSPGFVSYRSKKHGNIFIQIFTTIINAKINSPTRTEKIYLYLF